MGIFAIVAIGFLVAVFLITGGGKTPAGTTSTNPFVNFSPFGKPSANITTNTGENTAGTNTPTGNGEIIPIQTGSLSLLRQITPNPVAGIFPINRIGKSYIDFIEKETGNIFETRIADMQMNRLSNSIMPRIFEAYFANGGNSIVVRYLKNNSDVISSFDLDISKSKIVPGSSATSTSAMPSGRFLPAGVMDMKISSDMNSAFFMTRNAGFKDRNSFGSVFDFNKNTVSEVFQSAFSEWLPVYFNSAEVLLQTKASQKVPGFLYSLNIKTGVLQKVMGDINGLTTLPSPDGQKILYSESTKGGMTLHVYNRANETTTDLPKQTLPEKCVWTKDGLFIYCAISNTITSSEYPDTWYQGITSFSDNIWKINTQTGISAIILTTSSFTPQSMDMTHLTLSPLEDYLFFINKKDSTPWLYDLRSVGLQ